MPQLLCNQRLTLEVEWIDLANLAKWIKRWKICILLDGLVCGIVGYFYESRLIFCEPVGRVKIQETSKNVPRYYTLNRSVRDLLINSKEYKMELSKNADACLLITRMRDRLTWVLFSRAFINAIANYGSEMKTCQTGLLCKSIFFGFFCRRFEILSVKHLLCKQR